MFGLHSILTNAGYKMHMYVYVCMCIRYFVMHNTCYVHYYAYTCIIYVCCVVNMYRWYAASVCVRVCVCVCVCVYVCVYFYIHVHVCMCKCVVLCCVLYLTPAAYISCCASLEYS